MKRYRCLASDSIFILGFTSLFLMAWEVPCNFFPKIMGGNQGNTVFNAIDANLASDILAAGGYTNDNEITSTTSVMKLPLFVVY